MYLSIEDIQKYKEEVRDCFAPLHREVITAFVYGLFQLPPANVEAVRPGKWLPASTKPGVYAGMKCSECKARISYSDYNHGQHLYCHKCGAKMCEE